MLLVRRCLGWPSRRGRRARAALLDGDLIHDIVDMFTAAPPRPLAAAVVIVASKLVERDHIDTRLSVLLVLANRFEAHFAIKGVC
jgi:hypothetical protein